MGTAGNIKKHFVKHLFILFREQPELYSSSEVTQNIDFYTPLYL